MPGQLELSDSMELDKLIEQYNMESELWMPCNQFIKEHSNLMSVISVNDPQRFVYWQATHIYSSAYCYKMMLAAVTMSRASSYTVETITYPSLFSYYIKLC